MTDTITQELRDAAAKEGPGSPEADKLAAMEAASKENEGNNPPADPPEEPSAEPSAEPPVEDLSIGEPPADDAQQAPVEITIAPTGDKVIDDVAKLLVDKKVPDADKIMAEFSETGELSLASQAALVDALGDSVAKLTLQSLTDRAVTLKESGQKTRQEMLDYANQKFNGKDPSLTWKQMTEYARTEAGFSADDIAAMNSMLKAGGLQAQLVVDRIAQVYFASNGTSSPGDLLEGDSSSAANFQPISRAEYVEELRTAVQKYGEDSPQVQTLNRRRELSLQRGY